MTDIATITETTVLTIDLHAGDRPERFSGTPEEIVTAINNTSFHPEPTPQGFMARFNRYFPEFGGDGRTARTETFAAFVEDLIAFGVMRVVADDNPQG